MPEATMNAVSDHGKIRGNTIAGTYDDARHLLDELDNVGVSYTDVVNLLEAEGIEKFNNSYARLEDSIRTAAGNP